MFQMVAALALFVYASDFALAQRANDPAADAVIGTEARFQPVIAANGMVAAQERSSAAPRGWQTKIARRLGVSLAGPAA